MAVTTDKATPPLAGAEKDRPAPELVVAWVFGPLSRLLVPGLVRLRVPPQVVVLAHAAIGLAGALLLARGELVGAAVLLQAKTLLDNADGLLARASGRVTLLGRYLDTEADLVVNAAVFAALGAETGEPWLAFAGLVAATVLLGVDFNLAEAHREAHGRATPEPPRSGSSTERALEAAYRVVFGPQDRLVRTGSARRLARGLDGEEDAAATRRATLAYHDRLTLAFLANTGLSTQLAVLGICLVVGAPVVYLWLLLACLAPLPFLQLRRERLARRALHGAA
ncbi:MAG TPA: CDP-alcohol phosphatidyltransferase family protein [Gaiellaceae bacterium]|nr:CDP-alcohol phosphatidyltransferase family protein [Gaiellaceae bacterium]